MLAVKYCMQEAELNFEDSLYYPLGCMLHVSVDDLPKNIVSTSYGDDYA